MIAARLALALAAALPSLAWAQGSFEGRGSFDGQYMGELTLTSVVTGDCTAPPLGSLYPLTVSGGQVRFTYAPRFGTTLTGKIDRNGAFKATAPTKRGLVQMTGRVQGGAVTAAIVSPSCNYAFQARAQ